MLTAWSICDWLLERMEPLTTEKGIRSIIRKIVFNPVAKRFEFELDDKFWADVRSGRIVYIPGLASRLYYVSSRKTWSLLVGSFRQVNWRWDPEWVLYLPKGYEWIADEEDKYLAVKDAEPKIDDPVIIRFGQKMEKEHQADIEASLSAYFRFIDEIIVSSPVYKGVAVGNTGPLPVSKRKLLAAAKRKDPKTGFPAVAWGWAKHRKQESQFSQSNKPGIEAIRYKYVREGMAALSDILSKPDLTWLVRDHSNLGSILELRYGSTPGEELGPGAWFSSDGSRFISFLDPLDIKGSAFRQVARALASQFPEISPSDASAIMAWWLRKQYGAQGAKKILRRVGGMVELIEHLIKWRRYLEETTTMDNIASREKGWKWEEDDEEPTKERKEIKKGVQEVLYSGARCAPVVAEKMVCSRDTVSFFPGSLGKFPKRWLQEHELDILFEDAILEDGEFIKEYLGYLWEKVAGKKKDPVVSQAIGALVNKGWYHSRNGKKIQLSSEVKKGGKVVYRGKEARVKHAVAIVLNIKRRKGLAGVREFLADVRKGSK